MKSEIDYRFYKIVDQYDVFVARTADGEEPNLVSRHLWRVKAAIDQLWEALEAETVPEWFGVWMKAPVGPIDLDSSSNESLFDVVRAVSPSTITSLRGEAFAFKSAFKAVDLVSGGTRSEVVLPASIVRATVIGLFVVAPIGYLMHQFFVHSEPAIVFSLSVVAASLAFGSRTGLLLSLLSAVAYNLSVVPPVWGLSVPTVHEFLYSAINVAISLATPWLMDLRREERRSRHCSSMVELA